MRIWAFYVATLLDELDGFMDTTQKTWVTMRLEYGLCAQFIIIIQSSMWLLAIGRVYVIIWRVKNLKFCWYFNFCIYASIANSKVAIVVICNHDAYEAVSMPIQRLGLCME